MDSHFAFYYYFFYNFLFFSTDNDQKSNENILTFQKIEDMYNLILDTYYEPVDTAELLNSMLETMLNNVDFHLQHIFLIKII